MYRLVFFVPESHLESVKTAVFLAGAGKIGDYDQCCWQSLGQGQFRPLEGSRPFTGEHKRLEQLPEYRVEMVCDGPSIRKVVEALRLAHPYEEPAFDFTRLCDWVELP